MATQIPNKPLRQDSNNTGPGATGAGFTPQSASQPKLGRRTTGGLPKTPLNRAIAANNRRRPHLPSPKQIRTHGAANKTGQPLTGLTPAQLAQYHQQIASYNNKDDFYNKDDSYNKNAESAKADEHSHEFLKEKLIKATGATAAKKLLGESGKEFFEDVSEEYYKNKEDKHPIRKTARRLAIRKLLGFSAFGILGTIAGIGALVFFFSFLYKPEYVRQFLVDVHLARFNLQLQRRMGQLIASEGLVSADSTGRLNPIRRGGVLDMLVGYNPTTALERMGRSDGFELVIERRRRWNLRQANEFRGWRNKVTGEEWLMPENATRADKMRAMKKLEGELMEMFSYRNKIWRGKLLLDVRRTLGMKLIRFDDLGRIFNRKSRAEALNIDQRRQDNVIRDDQKIVSNSAEINEETEQNQKRMEDGEFTSQAAAEADEARVPLRERMLTRIKNSFAARPFYTVLRGLSFLNALFVTICLIWEAYVQNVDKVIEKRSGNYARLSYSTFNCADQGKKGDLTTRAWQACVDSLANFEYSTEYRNGIGMPSKGEQYDLPDELKPQTAMGEAPTVVRDALNLAWLSSAATKQIDVACKALLSNLGQLLTAAGEAILAIFSGSTSELAGQGIWQTLKVVIKVIGKTARNIAITIWLTDWLMPRIVEGYSGGDNGSQEEATQSFNKTGAGTEIIAQEMAKQSGGMVLSEDQLNEYTTELNQNFYIQESTRSWYGRLFDLSNVRSLAAQTLIRVPTSLGDLRVSVSTMVASISPFDYVRQKVISYSERSQPVWAAGSANLYDIKQFGIPLSLLEKCNDDESWCQRKNGEIIEPEYDVLEAKYGKCFKDSTAKMITKFDSPEYEVCFGDGADSLKKSEKGQRFALYKYDEFSIRESIYLQNDEDDSGLGGNSTTAPTSSGGGPPFSVSCQPQAGQPPLPAAVPMDGNAAGLPIVTPVVGRGGGTIAPGVRQDVAQCVQNMVSDASDSGLILNGGGFRDLAGQLAAGQRNGCPPNWTSSSQCSVPTAPVGQSNHGWGVAIDFSKNGRVLSRSDPEFAWLSANASRYGFQNLPSEAWHWSIDGR